MNRVRHIIGGVVILLSSLGQLHAQGTVQIRFENPPVERPGAGILVQQYYEAGLWFIPLPGTDGFVRRWSGDPRDPDNDSIAFLQATLGDSLMFGVSDGSLFDMVSVDLAEYSTVVPDAITVAFVGYRPDGSTMTVDFTSDGIIDGTGPLADFETFQFGPEWSGLSRVEIPNSGWSLDNLYVSIPEPGTWALLLGGGLLLGALKFRRRNG